MFGITDGKPEIGFYVVEIKRRRVFNSFDEAQKYLATLTSGMIDAVIDVQCYYRSVNQCAEEEE